MLLRTFFLRPVRRRPLRFLITIAGVAAGIAAVVATISASQAAVASGSGLRRWTWSQVTMGIVGLRLAACASRVATFCIECDALIALANLATAFLHGYPLDALADRESPLPPILLRLDATISGFEN